MPINTDLNIAPYFDDFDIEKQFYKILFKPAYAVQARELTQLQTILQNQVEQFGDNIYQEGSIIKGCNFTNLSGLEFVKIKDGGGVDVLSYVSGKTTEIIAGIETEVDVVYELEAASGLKANIIAGARGFETRAPDLDTFFINYINTEASYVGSTPQKFTPGQGLKINRYKYIGSTLYSTELEVANVNVTQLPNPTGKSFGIQVSQGVIFQKGHFLFSDDQTLIVSKYTDQPNDVSVGYEVVESLVTALQDSSLYDNANGSANENAPGADRLKLVPVLVAKETSVADLDPAFFTLIRYQNGSAVQLRDVSQFNSIAEEMAKRTYEESGNYIVDRFKIGFDRRNNDLTALIGKGTAYVKGFRVDTSGKQDFVIDQVSETSIQNNQATTIDYGNYVDVVDISGTVDLSYVKADLQNGGGSKIGEAFIRNITPTRVYLFGVKMSGANEFKNVEKIVGDSGVITIAVNSVLKQAQKAPLIFPTGSLYLKETTDMIVPVRAQESVSVTSDTITLTAAIGEDFALNQDDMVFVDASNTLIPILSYATSNNNSTLTIDLDPAASSDPAGTLYYNKRLTDAAPYAKEEVQPYVKVNFTSAKTKYSLGFPDVYRILDVYDSTGTRYTDSFKLYPNHKDHYYDISYMEHISGRPLPPDGVLTIKLAVFKVNSTTGEYFFTINSYPIDDEIEVLPVGNIRSYDIDVYRASNGQTYNLRNCYDFRPYVDRDGNVDYTDTSASSAGTVTTDVGAYTNSFSAGSYIVPPINSNVISDIESYLSRIDLVTADSYGKISIVKGEEAETPAPGKISEDELVVAEIMIPGYPALSPKEAADSGKFECGIKVKNRGTKNYTMRDIEKIEKRIEGLEYYISLNQLEQQAENLLILDENGLTRFKNGYIVDPFNDSLIANTEDPNYKAAIHFDRSILTPAVNTFPLDLKYKSGSSASIFPSVSEAEVATLSRDSNVKLMGQPYATNFRNCVSNFWKYNGQGTLSPDHDMAPSVTENPVPFNIDITSVFQDLNEAFPLTGTQWSGFGEDAGTTRVTRGRTTTTTTRVIERGTVTSLNVNDGGLNRVGDFVTNSSFEPYMRSRDVNIFISGLRPNTRHYFFFDKIDVNAHVWAGTSATSARSVQKIGSAGAAVSSDANGVLRAVFTIPEGTFFVGDRVLTVADVNQYSSIESASTSKSELVYHAYNISVEKTTISTRIPEFSTTTNQTTRNLPSRVTSVTEERNDRGDPLAQTFFIKAGMGRGSNSVFISKIDLYFKRKSDINGVTITLREVVNGYPSGQVLPFSKVHLAATEVNVSDDATAITEVFFDAPVRMDVEKEYAVVIMPDANDPNYLHFTSKVGGTDLTAGATQGQAVVMDWGDGVLFTSTNNRAWQSVQDEDIKFTLYRHNFNAATGSVTLTNDDHEFFTLSDWDGRFNQEEMIYKVHSAGYTVSIAQNSSVVTQSGNDFNVDYAAGDYILIENNAATLSDVFRVASVDSSTQMTLDKPCAFNGANGTGTPIIAGKVTHYNKFNRAELHIKQSSATASKFFAAGDTITGVVSGTQGTIGSVDDIELSYIQPFVQKSNDSVTNTSMSGYFTDPQNASNLYTLPMKFGDNNMFTKYGAKVYSKSNNFVSPKPFDIVVNMSNSSNVTSTPIVDLEISTLLAYQFKVTNDAATTSKYISKTIELAEDLDAEDLQVILTGHRPNGTDINVYIRPQNVNDGSVFDEIDWIELELFEGVNTYASATNPNDYREYKYRVADANKNGSGVITYTSSSGTFSSYRKFAIKIELLSDNIKVAPFVKDYRGIALT